MPPSEPDRAPIVLKIAPDGAVSGLYTEAIDLSVFGPDPEITRASDVIFDPERGAWIVDLLNGEYLTGRAADGRLLQDERGRGWSQRSTAIAAEVEYLQARL